MSACQVRCIASLVEDSITLACRARCIARLAFLTQRKLCFLQPFLPSASELYERVLARKKVLNRKAELCQNVNSDIRFLAVQRK